MAEDDDAAAERAVLGDELQQRGDPHGELIGLQLALAALPADAPSLRRRAIERRIAGVLDRHHDGLYGELAPHVDRLSNPDVLDPVLAVSRWSGGFADAIWLQTTIGDSPGLADVYRVMRTLAVARFVRRLEIGFGDYPALLAAIHADRPRSLRALVLGDRRRPRPRLRQINLESTRVFAELAPDLDELASGWPTPFERFDSPRLRVLELQGPWGSGANPPGAYPRFTGDFPVLAKLRLGQFTVDDDLLDRFPTVTDLTLSVCNLPSDWLDHLAASPQIQRLRSLDLAWTLTQDRIGEVQRNAAALARLDRVSLAESSVPPGAMADLRAALPNLTIVK